jgi:hypothetical protein
MAFRMGFSQFDVLSQIPHNDLETVLRTIPRQPMLSEEEFELIQNYFLKNAPDSLILPEKEKPGNLSLFEPVKVYLPGQPPLLTMIKADSILKRIYIGNRYSQLYTLDKNFNVKDSIELNSPPSCLIFQSDTSVIITLMGIMDPNDQSKGEIQQYDPIGKNLTTLLDSLKRPVHLEKVDLNLDGLDDYIVCNFGNYTGSLEVVENRANGNFIKHTVSSVPGARNTIVHDINGDGLPDFLALVTQGNERIIQYTNKGNFSFEEKTLLQFQPVYGSSYFEIADFDRDGFFDILYTNGDNADFSSILKPYHGVRIFLNDGKNQFRESWFYPMHGASMAKAVDFDKDGDLDIAAIAFFPNFKETPEQGFLYFENDGQGNFTPQATPLANSGRWLVMETADYDGDGDTDILLGALNFPSGVPRQLVQQWSDETTHLLVLRNELH